MKIHNPTITGSLIISGSLVVNGDPITAGGTTDTTLLNAFTASQTTKNSTLATYTSSVDTKFTALASSTASLISKTGSYATTGSNVFQGNQTITGSLYILQNLVVQGSSSINYISQSTLNIGTNLITVNAATPSVRFAGLAVIDSGSNGGSGSILYDSVHDEFVFVHKGNGTNVTSSHFIMGPETYDNLGNEIYLTTNTLPKGTGNEHLTNSNIIDTGTSVTINSDSNIVGTLIITSSNINTVVGTANINSYTQLNIVNKNAGNGASSDIVATNNTGTETGNFVDLGINSSTFVGLIGVANDGYLYHTGSNFLIGNTTRGAASLKFFSGNDATIFPIIVTGSTAIITGSILGTASFALTASYALSSAGGGGGGVIAVRTITTGSTTYTPTTGTTKILLEMVGGGGGGGGADIQYSAASGAGAGGYLRKWITGISSATTYTVTIGAGGVTGSALGGNGGDGGNTTFATDASAVPANTTFTAGGGRGGSGSAAGSTKTSRQGGAGGTCTNGDVNAGGGPGAGSISRGGTEGWNAGQGGSNIFGGGGFAPVSPVTDVAGGPGTGFGGGGGGAAAFSATGANGGAGAPGAIIITEY